MGTFVFWRRLRQRIYDLFIDDDGDDGDSDGDDGDDDDDGDDGDDGDSDGDVLVMCWCSFGDVLVMFR